MKKTLTANISGTVFHIEEDAFDRMQRYLASIRAQFSGSDGREEIMADIEARIAELFTERLAGKRQVLNVTDVEHVITVMGQPEDYMGDAETAQDTARPNSDQSHHTSSGQRRHKRLFRDPDDKWIGGVFGGLSAYFNIDPLWLRLAFIALFLLGKGSPVLIYILMWILVPKAETAAERLMMQGEPVTVDNLKKTFEEGAEKVKSSAERMAKEVDELGRKWNTADGKARFRGHADRLGSGLGTVIKKVIGVALLLFGFFWAMAMVGGLIGTGTLQYGSTDGWESGGPFALAGMLFSSPWQSIWSLVAVFLLGLIPVIGIMLGGFRLVFETRTPRWLGWTLGLTWVAALIVVIVTASFVGADFSKHETVDLEVPLIQPTGQTLYLENLDPVGQGQRKHFRYNHGSVDWSMDGFVMQKDSIRICWVGLDVQRSPDSLFHFYVERTAQGRSYKEAQTRASNIGFTLQQVDSVLFLSQWLAFPKADKFRVQRAHCVIEVPLGKAIHLGSGTGPLLDDIANVTNTYDGDMPDRTWTMTRRGLSMDIAPEQVPDEVLPMPTPPTPKEDRTSDKKNVPSATKNTVVSAGTNDRTRERKASLMPNFLGLMFHNL